MIILMDAIEELSQLSHSMRQAAGLLADEDIDETSSSASSKCSSTFLNIVALGNTVSWLITALLNAVSVLIYEFRIEWLHFYISGLSGFWIRNFNLITTGIEIAFFVWSSVKKCCFVLDCECRSGSWIFELEGV